jgi:flagellar assembly factor FliW
MGQVLSFPEGLIGFRDARRFVLLETGRAASPFRRLVALDVADLSFVVCDPRPLWPGYESSLPPEDAARDVLVIVTVPGEARELTANLMAPLVVDGASGVGRQLVLDTGRYSTRHPLPAIALAATA